MGILKKLFGIQETNQKEEDLLQEMDGNEVKIIKIENSNLNKIKDFHERLNKILFEYKEKTRQGKPIPHGLIEKLDYLEQKLKLKIEKIEKEVIAEGRDVSSVDDLLYGLEQTIKHM